MRVLVFGASITQGFWDTEGGWVARLRRHYDQIQVKRPTTYDQPEIFNLGISGDTTKGVLERFKNETEARLWPGEKFAFIFSVGTNNAVIENGINRSSPKEYGADLEKLIAQAREFSKLIMFVGLPPCEESKTTPIPWDKTIHYTNERIVLIDKAMREICIRNDFIHVPVFELFQEKIAKNEDLLADGLHPNNEGHELIFQLVRPKLDELINT